MARFARTRWARDGLGLSLVRVRLGRRSRPIRPALPIKWRSAPADIFRVTVAPGWYDDGYTPDVVRWWDGQGWTERTSPVPAVQMPAVPAVQVSPALAGQVSEPWGAPWGSSASSSVGYAGVSPTPSFGQGQFQGVPAFGAGSGVPAAPLAPPSAGRTGLVLVLVGLGVLIAATVVLRLAVGHGGVVWTGGFIVAAGLMVRGFAARHATRTPGSGSEAPLVAVVVVVALVCGYSVLDSLGAVGGADARHAPGPGDCFAERGEWLEQVSCGDPHDYVAVAPAATPQECATVGSGVYAQIDDDTVLCLRVDGADGG